MRRVLAITLLIAFGSPLVLPIFAATADPEASLPACCRSHGLHHCNMVKMPGQAASPAFTAPPCPLYPAAFTLPAVAVAILALSPAPSVAPVRSPTLPARAPRRAHAFIPSANLNRGPPIRPV